MHYLPLTILQTKDLETPRCLATLACVYPFALYYNENSTGNIYSISAGSPSGIKSYTLSGDDSEHFSLNENNITLDTVLDYEVPSDADGDNIYRLNILIEDGKGREKSLGVEVNIVDVWNK